MEQEMLAAADTLVNALKPQYREVRGVKVYAERAIPKIARKIHYKWPWLDVAVGECFEIDKDLQRIPDAPKAVLSTGRRFTARRLDGKLFIWRIK